MRRVVIVVAVVLLLVQAVSTVEARSKPTPTSGWTEFVRGDGALD